MLDIKKEKNEFLQNIRNTFEKFFGENSTNKINLMNYLPEEKWLEIKKSGLLLPFLPENYGGLKASQFNIQETLRIAGNYGVPVTLRTGIEGALVIQPLVSYANNELISEVLPLIFESEGGGLGITEPATSGSAIAREMQSYYEVIDEKTIFVNAVKYWQGNSNSEFLLIAAKEKKNGKLSKIINLIFVPKQYISSEMLVSEGLKAVRYAVNTVSSNIPKKYLIELSSHSGNPLREFQNIFIRSRLQLIGMTHGVIESINNNIHKYIRSGIEFVNYELNEIKNMYNASKVLYDYVCNNIDPSTSVSDKLLEANIVKSVGSEYSYNAAKLAQKLLGAKGYESGHPMSNIAIDIRPFTIFEGNNEMLYAEIFDTFSKSSEYEKENNIKIDKSVSIYNRLISDKRYLTKNNNSNILSSEIVEFLKTHIIKDVSQIQKVFIGRIISKFFILNQTDNSELIKFINKEIFKDITDYQYTLQYRK